MPQFPKISRLLKITAGAACLAAVLYIAGSMLIAYITLG